MTKTEALLAVVFGMLASFLVVLAFGGLIAVTSWVQVIALLAAVAIASGFTAWTLKRHHTGEWIAITVSITALLASSTLTVYGTTQSNRNAQDAIRASADQSFHDNKLAAYVDFLSATRAAFHTLPEIGQLYHYNEAGIAVPNHLDGSAPPADVLKTVSQAAATQDSKYGLINAYDLNEPAHQIAWQLYSYVYCLNNALTSWEANVNAEKDIGYKRFAQLQAVDYFDRRSAYVPSGPINEQINCNHDLPVSKRDALYGGDVQTKDPARAPSKVIAQLEAEVRKIAGVPDQK